MSIIAEKYRVSRQTVYRHLRQLESRDIVKKDKDNKYVLVKQTDTKTYKNEGLKENEIWKQDAAPFHIFTEHPDHLGFNATHVPVRLLDYGSKDPIFVSRSEARRLLLRFERFSRITLDFEGVKDIRQGFADEVFRVFPHKHPDCRIEAVNCNEQVRMMIDHVKNTK